MIPRDAGGMTAGDGKGQISPRRSGPGTFRSRHAPRPPMPRSGAPPRAKGTSTERFDLLVVGHINIDHELHVPHLPKDDQTVPVGRRRASLGGTASNIARWSSLLGLNVALAAFVGPDLPSSFEQRLRLDGVDIGAVTARRGEFTPACWIIEDGRGGQITVIDQGAMGSTGRESLPNKQLRSASWVHLATGDPVYQIRVAEEARRRGAKVACDPAQEIHYRWNRKDLQRLLQSCEIVFGNEEELGQMARLLGLAGAERLIEKVPLAIMTRASRGARAFARTEVAEVPAVPIKGIHRVTGAGDAFRGGFYRAWFTGEPLVDCLRWGTAAAAVAVETAPGPSGELPPAKDVERLVAKGPTKRPPRRRP